MKTFSFKYRQNKELVFYSPELTQILNRLIPDIPNSGSFDLLETSKKGNYSFDNFFTDGFANVEQTYLLISNELISNDLATLCSGHKIELTEKGKLMKSHQTWENFVKFNELEKKARINDLWTKTYWVKYEFIKQLITAIITAIITIILAYITFCHKK